MLTMRPAYGLPHHDLAINNINYTLHSGFYGQVGTPSHQDINLKPLWPCLQAVHWGDVLAHMREEDKQNATQWVRHHTQPCPGCGSRIEKNGGCNHMSCSVCRRQFCWVRLKLPQPLLCCRHNHTRLQSMIDPLHQVLLHASSAAEQACKTVNLCHSSPVLLSALSLIPVMLLNKHTRLQSHVVPCHMPALCPSVRDPFHGGEHFSIAAATCPCSSAWCNLALPDPCHVGEPPLSQ